MTRSDPPRVAAALLRRFVDDNEPLVGDLLEGFAVRQSRLWFWQQVVLAIAIRAFRHRDEQGPLRLTGRSSVLPAEERRNLEPRRINLSASPLPHVGGLGLVAFGALLALVRPQALWIFLPAILGGVALGFTMAAIRRHALPQPGSRTLLRDSDEVPHTS